MVVVTRVKEGELRGRQLQGAKLKVDYEVSAATEAEATKVEETFANPSKAADFSKTFSESLVEKDSASGAEVKEVVPEEATVVRTVVNSTPAPAPAPTTSISSTS